MDFNSIQDGHFWGCSRMIGGCLGQKSPLPKFSHTYPTIMKLGTVIPYLKKIQKIYESHVTPLEFCPHQHFFTVNQQIVRYQKIQIQTAFCYRYRLQIAKMTTLDLLKIKVFWNKYYDVIISARDVTNKILTHVSYYIVNVVIRLKFL